MWHQCSLSSVFFASSVIATLLDDDEAFSALKFCHTFVLNFALLKTIELIICFSATLGGLFGDADDISSDEERGGNVQKGDDENQV